MQRLPLYHPRVLERLAQLVAPQLGLLFKNGAYYVINAVGDPTPITSAPDAVRKEFVDAIAAAALRAEPLLGNAIFLQAGETVKALSPSILSKLGSVVSTGAQAVGNVVKQGALKAATDIVSKIMIGVGLLSYTQKDKAYKIWKSIQDGFTPVDPDVVPVDPKPIIDNTNELELLMKQRELLVEKLKDIQTLLKPENIDSEDERRKLMEDVTRTVNTLKTSNERIAFLTKDIVSDEPDEQPAPTVIIEDFTDVTGPVQGPAPAPAPIGEAARDDDDDDAVNAGGKPLFETDPLLFFLLNEKKVKKGKKKAKNAPPTVTEFLQPIDPNLYRTKDVIKKQSAGAPKAAKKTAWMIHVAKYAKDNGLNYFDALKKAKASYKK